MMMNPKQSTTHTIHTHFTAMRRQSGGSGAASRWDDSNKELALLRLEVEVRACE